MEHARDWPMDVLLAIRGDLAEVRADIAALSAKVDGIEVRVSRVEDDVRRLDRRIDQLMLMQFATLAAATSAIVASVLGTVLG